MSNFKFNTLVTAIALVLHGSLKSVSAQTKSPLMESLSAELTYAMDQLQASDGTKPYFIGYTVYEEQRAIVGATLGALTQINWIENAISIWISESAITIWTTPINSAEVAPRTPGGAGNISLPIEDNAKAIRHAVWLHTDRIFKQSVNRLTKIKTNRQVRVEEEDQSDDFSRETPQVYSDARTTLELDREQWATRLRKISAIAREFPLIYNSAAIIGAYAGNRTIVNSEGTRLQTSQTRFRITLTAATKADDGMDLDQTYTFNAATIMGLPDEATIESAFRGVIAQVLALAAAPLAEPYIGPAILRNRAAAVFFHEIFGHRIEGHRQKDVTEGQTFTKMIDKEVLPPFLSVKDDPTMKRFGKIDLRGYYPFDDEGVKSSPVTLVDKGTLKTFLLSRSPVEGFSVSNGHGRRQPGNAVVSRQGNLIVESSKQIPVDQLRAELIKECKRQDKPYGLLFDDISGGFTMTNRQGPQSFKVLPVVVYRVFTDGREDELIRGADVVGTPLTCFEKITHTGDDPAVFNGTCGAESGWVPVSAISPSILVSTIEVEKRQRDQTRPPILDPPPLSFQH